MQLLIPVDISDASAIRKAIEFLTSRLGPTAAVITLPQPAPSMPHGVVASTLNPTPVPAVPTPPAPAVATPTVDPNARDADGILWDARIHSETRKTNDDGRWKKRRGVDDNTMATVKAELLAARPAGTIPANAPPAIPVVVVPVPPPAVPTIPAVAAPTSAPPIPAAPIPVPMVAAPLPPPFPPPGWTAHPDAAGYFYKDQTVLSEADLHAQQAAAPVVPSPATAVKFEEVLGVMSSKLVEGKVDMTKLNEMSQRLGNVVPFARLCELPATWSAVFAELSAL